jgi:peptidoglycan/LPS O-acetylase OafA/YrhL
MMSWRRLPRRGASVYRPQLDTLRAVAVFAVMLAHFAPRAMKRLPLGELGVRLFFVLSGSLISGILLDAPIVATIFMAAVSWRFYEGPINQLKTRIPYDSRREPWGLTRFGGPVLEQR